MKKNNKINPTRQNVAVSPELMDGGTILTPKSKFPCGNRGDQLTEREVQNYTAEQQGLGKTSQFGTTGL